MNTDVDAFIANSEQWKNETKLLRQILLQCDLEEGYKWKTPCYMYRGKNVALIGLLKESCTLSFIKGGLLADMEGILQKPGDHSQHVRIVRFTSKEQIIAMTAILKSYLFEAIELEKQGTKPVADGSAILEPNDELITVFDEHPDFKVAFMNLTPGRQRAYHIFFSGAKQSNTRTARIKKYIPRIMEGFGFNDCVCGLSKRMPGCDGSHKELKKQK